MDGVWILYEQSMKKAILIQDIIRLIHGIKDFLISLRRACYHKEKVLKKNWAKDYPTGNFR